MFRDEFNKIEVLLQKVIVRAQKGASMQQVEKMNEFWAELKQFERFVERVAEKAEAASV